MCAGERQLIDCPSPAGCTRGRATSAEAPVASSLEDVQQVVEQFLTKHPDHKTSAVTLTPLSDSRSTRFNAIDR